MWWSISLFHTLGSQSQVNFCQFIASLSYLASPSQLQLHRKTLPQNKLPENEQVCTFCPLFFKIFLNILESFKKGMVNIRYRKEGKKCVQKQHTLSNSACRVQQMQISVIKKSDQDIQGIEVYQHYSAELLSGNLQKGKYLYSHIVENAEEPRHRRHHGFGTDITIKQRTEREHAITSIFLKQHIDLYHYVFDDENVFLF